MSPSPIGEVPSFRGSQASGQQFDVGDSALQNPMLFRQISDELGIEDGFLGLVGRRSHVTCVVGQVL